MDTIAFLVGVLLHVDQHLTSFALDHGTWVYGLLFLIVFVETGLVVMPFLPGDSLLFVVGALCGAGTLNLPSVIGLLSIAAIAGDQLNYRIGSHFGPRVFRWERSRLFNRQAFNQAHAFYERHGAITIILARFMAFIRTFPPFVAGVAQMDRARFTTYNAVGGALWVVSLTVAGFLFGNIAWVQGKLSTIIWALVLVPGLIAGFGAWKARRNAPHGT